MKEALKKLTPKQIDFICTECSVSEEELKNMGKEQLCSDIYETMCEIEIDEVCSKEGDEDTERCEIASDIVTLLGNALAEKEGFFDSQDEDNE